MLLAIDIGNTTTKFGVFDGEELISRQIIPTIRQKNAAEIYESIQNQLNYNFRDVIISTVVPELNDSFQKLAEKYLNSAATFVDHDFDFGFEIKYDPPESVGIDRLIAAYGGVQKYGTPCLVCDFGTATNIEVVNSKNKYIGGIITAGMNLLADSLHQRTSKLPKIELRKPVKTIGNSTISAIQSGVYYGYIGLVDGLIKRMIDELDKKPKVIGTGGLVNLIAQSSIMIDIVDEKLMLDGLRLIYQKSHNEKK